MRGKHFSWSNWSDGPYFGTLEISSDRFPAVLPEGIWKGEGGKWSPGMWGGVWVRRGERQSWFVIGVAMLFPFDPVTKIKALARGMPARSIFRERKKIPKKKKILKVWRLISLCGCYQGVFVESAHLVLKQGTEPRSEISHQRSHS